MTTSEPHLVTLPCNGPIEFVSPASVLTRQNRLPPSVKWREANLRFTASPSLAGDADTRTFVLDAERFLWSPAGGDAEAPGNPAAEPHIEPYMAAQLFYQVQDALNAALGCGLQAHTQALRIKPTYRKPERDVFQRLRPKSYGLAAWRRAHSEWLRSVMQAAPTVDNQATGSATGAPLWQNDLAQLMNQLERPVAIDMRATRHEQAREMLVDLIFPPQTSHPPVRTILESGQLAIAPEEIGTASANRDRLALAQMIAAAVLVQSGIRGDRATLTVRALQKATEQGTEPSENAFLKLEISRNGWGLDLQRAARLDLNQVFPRTIGTLAIEQLQ